MSAIPWNWPCMSYNLLHLMSTDHKFSHACFTKTNAAQNKIVVQSSLKTSRSSRHMSRSHLPVKLKFRCLLKTFICLLKIMTFGPVIKYFNTLFRYNIISDIHLYRLSYVCELDPGAHMRCIWFLLKTGCDNFVIHLYKTHFIFWIKVYSGKNSIAFGETLDIRIDFPVCVCIYIESLHILFVSMHI
jgi:hypothetical protein